MPGFSPCQSSCASKVDGIIITSASKYVRSLHAGLPEPRVAGCLRRAASESNQHRSHSCSYWQLFTKIMLPLVAPGLVASAIFCLLLSWNEFSFALTLTYTIKSQILPIAIAGMTNDRGTLFGQMGAGGLRPEIPGTGTHGRHHQGLRAYPALSAAVLSVCIPHCKKR